MDTKKTYSQKLLDPRWQRKRLEVLNRDNFTCQCCGDTENTLHVHHRIYQSNDPWETDTKHLVTLCVDCHEFEGSVKKEYESCFLKEFYKAGFLPSDLFSFSEAFFYMKIQDGSQRVAAAYSFALSDPTAQSFILKKYDEQLDILKIEREREKLEREAMGIKDELPF